MKGEIKVLVFIISGFFLIFLFVWAGATSGFLKEGPLKLFEKRQLDMPESVACPMDAKLCSDGSYVGRIPPDCDFAACPKEDLVNVCKETGCSLQLCSHKDIVTTCEYLPEYACYRSARCERQANGSCGWTMSDELDRCLVEARR